MSDASLSRPSSAFLLLALLGCLFLPAAARGEPVRPSSPVSIQADRLEYLQNESRYLADGHVVLDYGGLRLTADHLVYDDRTGEMNATGGVVMTEGTQRVTMERLQFNLRTMSGLMHQADLRMTDPPYHLTARQIERLPDGTLRAEAASFTTCDTVCELGTPSWQFRATRLRVRLEDYLVASGVSLRIKDVPVAYLPWLIYPVKLERQSGLLIPKFGVNSDEGFQYVQPLYLVLGRSHDATLSLDLRSRLGLGLETEYRYRLTETGQGLADLHYFHNKKTGADLLAYRLEHQQRWGDRWRLQWDVNLVNHDDFFTQLSDSIIDRSLAGLESVASLTYQRQEQFFYLTVSYTQNLTDSNQASVQRLPEAGYRLTNYRLGRLPLYAGLEATAVHFIQGESLRLDDRGDPRELRLDLFPTVTARWEPVRGVVVTPTAGVRETYYRSRSLIPSGSVTREMGYLALRVDAQLIRRYATVVHLVEPAVLYEYAHQWDRGDQTVAPQFDDVDAAPEKRHVTLMLTQRLRLPDRQAGRTGAQSIAPGAQGAGDLLWMRIAESYGLRQSAVEPFSDLRLEAETAPTPALRLAAESFVNLYGGGVSVMNSEARATVDDWLVVALGQRYTRHGSVPQRGDLFSSETAIVADPIGGQERIAAIRWGAQVTLPWRLALATKTLLDLEHHQLTEMSYGLRWRGAFNECWSLTLVYQQFSDERQVSFLITLRGVSGSESKGVKELFLQ